MIFFFKRVNHDNHVSSNMPKHACHWKTNHSLKGHIAPHKLTRLSIATTATFYHTTVRESHPVMKHIPSLNVLSHQTNIQIPWISMNHHFRTMTDSREVPCQAWLSFTFAFLGAVTRISALALSVRRMMRVSGLKLSKTCQPESALGNRFKSSESMVQWWGRLT